MFIMLALALLLTIVASPMVTLLIGFAGAPGALLALPAKDKDTPEHRLMLAILATGAGQTYASLAWAAAAVLVFQSLAAEMGSVGTVLAFLLAWMTAGAPSLWASKDIARDPDMRNPQHSALGLTLGFTHLGFWLFWFWPPAISPLWGWIARVLPV